MPGLTCVDVEVAGITTSLRAETSHNMLLDRLSGWFPRSPDGARPEIVLNIGADVSSPPERDPDVHWPNPGLELWWDGPVMAGRHGQDTGALVGPDGGEVGCVPEDAWRPIQLVPFVLAHLLGARSRHVLHAATIVRDGRACVVLGDSGSGKSTVAMAAAASGWSAASDDLAVIGLGDDALLVRSLAKPFAVPPEAAPPSSEPISEDRRGRHRPGNLVPIAGCWPIAGVMIAEHGATPTTELARCAGADAFQHVMSSLLMVGDRSRRHELFGIAAAVARLPAWHLRLGADAATRLDQVAAQAGKVADAIHLGR